MIPNAKAAVIERIDELIPALMAYEDRIDRFVELIVRPDGTCLLMGGDPNGECFEEIGGFRSIEDLVLELQFGGFAAVVAEVVCEPAD